MADTSQDKSEQPTSFKLGRAREKGSVARGTDLSFFTALAAIFAYAWIAGPRVGIAVAQASRDAIIQGFALADGRYVVLPVVVTMFATVIPPLLVLIAVVVAVVLFFEIVQTGVVFSAEPLKPDFSRLNPATGLKRLFTLRMMIETGKNVVKLCVYATVGFLIVRNALRSDTGSIVDGGGLLAVMAHSGLRLLAAFVGVAAFFAIIDQLIVRKDFLKKMRMSKQEVRQEAREREGDPRIKQKRKRLHAQLTEMNQSVRGLRGADVLITNPEHIALALRYDRRTMRAPLIVSVGTNRFAQKLKRLAFIYGVPIVENRPLARELFRKSALNLPVPENCFRPVADIYRALRRKSGKARQEQ